MDKVIRGHGYTVKKTVANRHGIYQNVIATNGGGASGFHALTLLKNPYADASLKIISHQYLVVKFKNLI